tara:strand:+ start:171 stop:1391 length:1221 start_codon:yes stop_codon:yes gene_type:complete
MLISFVDFESLEHKKIMKGTLIFPLAGLGQRFVNEGYVQTKPLIHAGKRTIIQWGLDSISDLNNLNVVFTVRKDQCIINGIDSYLKQIIPNCKIVELDSPTNGSLETVALTLRELSSEGPLFIHTSDIVLPNPVELTKIFQNDDIEAATFTFKANNPSYSYCKLVDENSEFVESMIEKEIVSQIANVGIYCFRSTKLFMKYTDEILASQKKIKSEYYISSVFENLIKDGNKVKSLDVEEVNVIGTPKELNFFTKFVIPTMNPNAIGFVSDHSGFLFKDQLKNIFYENGYEIVDYGCFSEQGCDYSDYVPIACEGIHKSEVQIVIASCKSGQGINICANHQKNIISVIPKGFESLLYARKHNCPNFLSFGSEVWEPQNAFDAFVKVYNKSHFEGGRHSTRIQKFLNL